MKSKQEVQALEGVKVIDISTMFAAGHISSIFGDFGAEVIKIEHPRGDPIRKLGWMKDGKSLWWKLMGRNKKCITLNLSNPKGQTLLKRLVRGADILIENFRPGTLEKWNIGYEDLKPINPGLIMVRVTGYGQDGPYSGQPGFGTLAEALSGVAHLTGFPDGPPILPPVALADFVTSLYGVSAAMMCIYHRDINKTGEGQYIDISLVESMFSILGPQASVFDQLGEVITRGGNQSNFTAPRNLYITSDNKWVALSASTQSIAERVLRAVEREELIKDERFVDNESRMKNRVELDRIIADWIGSHKLNDVLERFNEYEAAIAPVYDISDMIEDPQFIHREIITGVPDCHFGELKMQNVNPRLSKTPGRIQHTGPELGEHNREIYIDKLNLSNEEFEAFRKDNII